MNESGRDQIKTQAGADVIIPRTLEAFDQKYLNYARTFLTENPINKGAIEASVEGKDISFDDKLNQLAALKMGTDFVWASRELPDDLQTNPPRAEDFVNASPVGDSQTGLFVFGTIQDALSTYRRVSTASEGTGYDQMFLSVAPESVWLISK